MSYHLNVTKHPTMKKQLLFGVISMVVGAGLALAAPPINPAAGTNTGAAGVPAGVPGAALQAAAKNSGGAALQSLRQYYGPKAQLKKVQQWNDNGVDVEYYSVTMNGGQASASVTSRGDLITTGVPVTIANLPPAVQQTVGLFRAQPAHLVQQDTHNYNLSAKSASGQKYVIEVNSVGRIIEIRSPEQLREDAGSNRSGQLPAQVAQIARQRFGTMTIDGGAPAVRDPGYYTVFFHSSAGQGWAILNANNDVPEYHTPIPLTSLPPAVMQTIKTQLNGDQITNVTMGTDRLYQVTEKLSGETLVMYIRPNGTVAWMSGRGQAAAKH